MNIPLPSLPTDNLYKFISLSGLVLLVATLIAYPYLSYIMIGEINQSNSHKSRIAKQLNEYHDYSDLIIRRSKHLYFHLEKKSNPLFTETEILNKLDSNFFLEEGFRIYIDNKILNNELTETELRIGEELIKEGEITKGKFKAGVDSLYLMESKLEEVVFITSVFNYNVYIFLSILGFLLLSTGFYFWYRKVQKYEDCDSTKTRRRLY